MKKPPRAAPDAERPEPELAEGQRRALSQRGGPIEGDGDAEWASQLTAALATTDEAEADDLTHGFHSYPARMHPRLARELIRALTEPGDRVLDPFCGSGTVLIEALVAGCASLGVDLNPLALRIAEVQCALRDEAARERFFAAAQSVTRASLERVQNRTRPNVSIGRAEQASYDPHVLLELAGLYEEIRAVSETDDRRALSIVFSSLVVKFSRQRADTSNWHVDKRIRKGLCSEFFERKAHELSLRWEALYEAAPPRARPARLFEGDARHLAELLPQRTAAELILCSPPYGGTYDYARQHALRNAWFGIDPQRWEADEIGARRHLSTGDTSEAAARWDDELSAFLRSARHMLAPGGRIVLWLGDAELSGYRVPADAQIASLAPDADLQLVARATQLRADARSGHPRGEHLLLLQPATRAGKRQE